MPGSITGRKAGFQHSILLLIEKNRINSFKSVIILTEYNVYNKHMIVTRKIDNAQGNQCQ